MKEKIIKTVNKMLNKQFIYSTVTTTVLDYDINEDRGRFYLYTDRKEEPYDRPLDTALNFLKEFSPVINVPAIVPDHPAAPQMLGASDLAVQLKTILMDNIEKIKTDKEYIPQAQAINDNVKTVIDLAKTEVAYVAAMNKNNRNDW